MTSIPANLDTRFKEKHIVVTGGGGNFGREGCRFFAARGAKITALDLNITTLCETVDIVKKETSEAQIECWECNVTDPSSVQSAIDSACEKFGTPDMCWNNAGYQGEIKPCLEYSIQDFANVMNINVTGMFTVLQIVAKKMAAANTRAEGDNNNSRPTSFPFSIVNTASVAAMRGTPAMPAYASSKAAILSMTVSTAKDLAPHGIRVNSISPALIGPGFMWDRQNELHAASGSPYFASDPEAVAAAKIGSVPMKRLGTMEEVIKAAAFLLSDDSSYTTAFNMVVDGGMAGGLRA